MQIKVAFLSAGLGNIFRGFEISSQVWFEEIKSRDGIDARLFAGGNTERATKVWNLYRNGKICNILKNVRLLRMAAESNKLHSV